MNTGQCMQTDVFYSINRFDPPPAPPPPHTRARDGGIPPRALSPWYHAAILHRSMQVVLV